MTTAILLSFHGTVEHASEIPAFLANIRRGRPTPDAIVAEVTHRFEQIGGSPLTQLSQAQADALSDRLGVVTRIAGRLWRPYPREVVAQLVAEGVTRVVSLPLAPQSVDVYHATVREALAAHPEVTLVAVPTWGTEPALIDAFDEAIEEGLRAFPEPTRHAAAVVLSAHSLPRRVIDAGDPYEAQFRAMAGLVAERVAARGNPVRIAFQSQGMTGDVWLGPDLPTTFTELAAAGARDVLVAPIGFVADHVETLYDIDIEAHATAKRAGLSRVARMPAMNTRPRFIDALESVARRALGAA